MRRWGGAGRVGSCRVMLGRVELGHTGWVGSGQVRLSQMGLGRVGLDGSCWDIFFNFCFPVPSPVHQLSVCFVERGHPRTSDRPKSGYGWRDRFATCWGRSRWLRGCPRCRKKSRLTFSWWKTFSRFYFIATIQISKHMVAKTLPRERVKVDWINLFSEVHLHIIVFDW